MEVGNATVKATVRTAVERREKTPRCVWLGEEYFEDVRIYVRGCRRDVWYSRRQDGGLRAIRKDVVGIRALSAVSTRTLDASKYGLELEVAADVRMGV